MNPNLELNYTTDAQPQGFALKELLDMLLEARWLIAGSLLFFFVVGLVAIFVQPPVYRSETVIEIPLEHAEVGLLSTSPALAGLLETTNINTELEILKSQQILGPVVDDLKLDVIPAPNYFPIFGDAVARNNNRKVVYVARRWLRLKDYAWGGEQFGLDELDIPAEFYGQEFIVKALPDGEYQVRDSEGRLLSVGFVGMPDTDWLPTEDPHTLLVSELKAPSGTEFRILRIRRDQAIDRLKNRVAVTQKGNKERKESSALVLISVEGPSKEKVHAIDKSVVDTYLTKEMDRTATNVDSYMKVLKEQLATIEAQMKSAESVMNKYRSTHTPVDLDLEARILLDKMVTAESQLTQLQQEREQLTLRYTPQHPDYFRIEELGTQIDSLRSHINNMKASSRSLPEEEQTVLNLSRDLKVSTSLYTLLLNRFHELNLFNTSTAGRTRIVDRRIGPINAENSILMTAYLLLGLLTGFALAFLKRHFKDKIDDPDILEDKLGYPVYAVIPRSLKQKKISGNLKDNREGHSKVLATQHSDEPAVESLRSLRTSIHFALLDAKNNVLLVTGPAPGVGKSFVSINLCALLASAGKKVLLIDADMRKGLIHRHFGMIGRYTVGMSDAVASTTFSVEDVVTNTDIANLDFIPSGTRPPNPSELLAHESFAAALKQISQNYDHVVIDSPPVLAVTDAAILGPLAGATLLVVRSGEHSLHEVQESVKRLRQVGTNLRGIVFNDYNVSGKYFGYAKYYDYAYQYSAKN